MKRLLFAILLLPCLLGAAPPTKQLSKKARAALEYALNNPEIRLESNFVFKKRTLIGYDQKTGKPKYRWDEVSLVIPNKSVHAEVKDFLLPIMYPQKYLREKLRE